MRRCRRNQPVTDRAVIGTVINKPGRDASWLYPAHLNKANRLVIDFPHIKDVLDWHHEEVRRNLGKLGVQHLALQLEEFRDKYRIIGVPVDWRDRPLRRADIAVDLRLFTHVPATHTSTGFRVDYAIPAAEYQDIDGQLMVHFRMPENSVASQTVDAASYLL